jgi:hypothetical protein
MISLRLSNHALMRPSNLGISSVQATMGLTSQIQGEAEPASLAVFTVRMTLDLVARSIGPRRTTKITRGLLDEPRQKG